MKNLTDNSFLAYLLTNFKINKIDLSLIDNSLRDKLFKLINKKPIIPSNEEIKKNPPSRSAKLRYAIKEKNILNFEKEILEKFNYLLEIENLSKKI